MKDYTTPIYTQTADDLEGRVLAVLIERAGESVSRQYLARYVFGKEIPRDALLYSPEDRQIREAIRRLQLREFPIVSSSRSAGYMIVTDEAELDACIAETVSRRKSLDEKINALRRARRKLPAIRAARTEHVSQPALFDTLRRGPGGDIFGGGR